MKRNAHRLFGAYLASIASPRLVDKYPELVFRVPFVSQIFSDAKFIFLVRNGWDTCASIDTWSARNGIQKNGEVHDWWGVNQRKWKLMLEELVYPDPYFAQVKNVTPSLNTHTDMAALEWVVTMREGMRRLEQNQQHIIMVRYEDLVTNPRETLSDISKFTNLAQDETFVRYAEAVLKPTPIYETYDLHPVLKPLFDETMQLLGYS